MADNRQIAQKTLEAVGGKENVIQVAHCMTRLRFNLKDQSLPKDEEVKGIDGVLGVARSGGQYQIIIGQNVSKVYEEVRKIGGFGGESAEEGQTEAVPKKLTLKAVGSNVLNYVSGSITPMIPVLMAAGMFKTMMAILGPDFLKVISAESHMYILLDFLYDAGFYFLPILVGFFAAKRSGVNQVLGAYMGCILIAPDFLKLAEAGEGFSVFGIPCPLNDYSQSLLPIILSVWVMGYVNKFIGRHIPDILSTVFTPFLTMLVMTPVSLCVLAPAGAFIGEYVSNGLIAFGGVGGFVAVGLVAALWQLLVLTGMHHVLILMMLNNLFTIGYMDGVCVSGAFATFATFGVALGAFLRLKDKKEKSMSLGFFVSGILGGVTEPTMYGLCFSHKRTFATLMAGAFAGGIYGGMTHVAMYLMGSTNVLTVMGFIAGGTSNMVNGCIACGLSLIVSAALTYLFGFSGQELETAG